MQMLFGNHELLQNPDKKNWLNLEILDKQNTITHLQRECEELRNISHQKSTRINYAMVCLISISKNRNRLIKKYKQHAKRS